MSRTEAQPLRSPNEEAIERILVQAYPSLVSDAYESLLASRAVDPLIRQGKPTAVANAEGATLVCRAAWLRMSSPEIRIHAAPCNDYHVCTLLDADLQPFASIGTRTAGSAHQKLILIAPNGTGSTTHDAQEIRCPTELIAILTHRVYFGRDNAVADASPFRVEDERGVPLVDLDGPAEAVDAVAHVEALRPEQYFLDAINAVHETAALPPSRALKHAVQKSFAAIAAADRSCALTKGWTTIDHRGRDRSPECRAVAARAGYFSAMSHDVLELATRCDASGNALDGARPYRITFERWNEPPANASWFLYVTPAMPAHIDLVRAEPAMTIILGPSPPSDGVNWIRTLPREEPLEVRLILCWPSERARSEIWTPPEIVALSES